MKELLEKWEEYRSWTRKEDKDPSFEGFMDWMVEPLETTN